MGWRARRQGLALGVVVGLDVGVLAAGGSFIGSRCLRGAIDVPNRLHPVSPALSTRWWLWLMIARRLLQRPVRCVLLNLQMVRLPCEGRVAQCTS